MKVCCERCEKGVRRNNITGLYDDGVQMFIKPYLLHNEEMILCNECYDKFLEFLEDKE